PKARARWGCPIGLATLRRSVPAQTLRRSVANRTASGDTYKGQRIHWWRQDENLPPAVGLGSEPVLAYNPGPKRPGRGGNFVADNASELVVETFKLTKIYQNRQIALNDVTLRIEPGCVLGLLGPNGAGKTTFLRLILGLHRPTAGWVKVF